PITPKAAELFPFPYPVLTRTIDSARATVPSLGGRWSRGRAHLSGCRRPSRRPRPSKMRRGIPFTPASLRATPRSSEICARLLQRPPADAASVAVPQCSGSRWESGAVLATVTGEVAPLSPLGHGLGRRGRRRRQRLREPASQETGCGTRRELLHDGW